MALFGNLIGLIALVCAIWVIYDVFAKQKRMKLVEKIIWTVCAVVFSIITAIVYYFVKERK